MSSPGEPSDEVDFSQSRFHKVIFRDTVIRGAWQKRVEIDGYVDEHQWGFLLLEGVWAVVSAASLVGVLLSRPSPRG